MIYTKKSLACPLPPSPLRCFARNSWAWTRGFKVVVHYSFVPRRTKIRRLPAKNSKGTIKAASWLATKRSNHLLKHMNPQIILLQIGEFDSIDDALYSNLQHV